MVTGGMRDCGRNVGDGDCGLKVGDDPDPGEFLPETLPVEFTDDDRDKL